MFGKPREKDKKIEKRHYEIASAMQKAFEEIVFYLLKNLKSKGGKSGNIVLAGGAAMNCVFNGLLHKNNLYKKNYIPAYPDDLVSIGAAYLANNIYSKRAEKFFMKSITFSGQILLTKKLRMNY